jgi:hypothetical protein
MRAEIVEVVACCDSCQRIKAEHQRPAGLLEPSDLPVCKWDDINMNFITGLPRTQERNDAIWVIVDRSTSAAHFIPVKATHPMSKLAQRYIEKILRLHGAQRSITSNKGPRFVTQFWQSSQDAMGTSLEYNLAYLEIGGETKRVKQLMEDFLRAFVQTYGSDWEKSLSYAEFS